MLYHHISEKERRQIEELVQAGNSNKTIAARLGRSCRTIGREIRRNTAYGGRGYFSKRAQELALARRQNSKVPKISEKTWAKVFELYNLDLSPEQIASQVKISHESIYRRIYAEIKAGKHPPRNINDYQHHPLNSFRKLLCGNDCKFPVIFWDPSVCRFVL